MINDTPPLLLHFAGNARVAMAQPFAPAQSASAYHTQHMHARLNNTHRSLHHTCARSAFSPSHPLAPSTGSRAQYFQKEEDLEDLRDKFATLETIQSSTTTVSHREKLQAKIRKAEGETAKARQR